MKKYLIRKPYVCSDDDIIGAKCYDYQSIIIALMTAFTDDIEIAVDAAKWCVEYNVGDKYVCFSPYGVRFEIEICEIKL